MATTITKDSAVTITYKVTTPGGNSLLGMVRTRLSSRAPKASSTASCSVVLKPTAWPSSAASTLGKMFS